MLGAGLVAKKAHELGLQVSITMLRLSFLVFLFASTNKRDTLFLLYVVLFFLDSNHCCFSLTILPGQALG